LLVQESTACHYVAIVGSKQLCQNKEYRLKEQPVYTISCYSQGSSPKKPGILREQEFDIITMTTKTPTVSDTPKTVSKGGTPGSKVSSSGPSLDEAIILTFLTGEMCLRGGSGWWTHELCLKKQVKQIHQEVDNSETEVLLGVWNEDDHMEWYEREGQKKHTASSVTHLYNGGDVCDITGKPRVCYVKFKCSRKGKSPSQISLYLTEQSVCVYTLTVEGQFICPLLETLDDHGLFQVQHTASSSLFNEGLPLDHPRSDETHDSESETGTESGQEEDSVISKDSDQVEWEPEQMEWESDQVERESDSDTDNPHSRQKKV
jgi:endoplasmic reticulum lectin 1